MRQVVLFLLVSLLPTGGDQDAIELRPLPADYREAIRDFARRVVRDSSEPRPIRKSAACVLSFGGWSSDIP